MRALILRVVVSGAGLGLASASAGQTVPVPYPGAEPLAADEAFVAYQVATAARAAGIAEDRAFAMLARRSFVSPARVGEVLDHLSPAAIEMHRKPIVDREADDRSFLSSLDDSALSGLARAIGTDVAGPSYGNAFLSALEAGAPGAVAGGFVAHEAEDGSLTFYEVQRPYFDVQRLEWVDSTRIRVVQFRARGS
jgi:hypothetical protein